MLKKIALTLAMLGFASSALAGTLTVKTVAPDGITSFAPSKNVQVGYEAGSGGGAGAGASTYSIATKNKAGDRVYVTTSATTALAYKVTSAGADLLPADGTTVPQTPSDSTIDAAFSIL